MADDDAPTTAEPWEHAHDPDEMEDIHRKFTPGFKARTPIEEEAAEEAERRELLARDAEEEWERRNPQPDWLALGRLIRQERIRLGISKREAARRAELSEAAWRHLEAGFKLIGETMVWPNPRNENLLAAAAAVEISPEVAFTYAARPMPEGLSVSPTPSALAERIQALDPTDRALVESLISRLEAEHPGD